MNHSRIDFKNQASRADVVIAPSTEQTLSFKARESDRAQQRA